MSTARYVQTAAINAQVDTAISDAATANTVATPTNVASAISAAGLATAAGISGVIK